MNVSFNPQDIIISALAPDLGIDIKNPIGREIIQGMDYESGDWTQSGNVTSITVSFTKPHSKPPFLVLVYAAPGTINTNTAYGEMFINYLSLHGTALQTTLSQAKYGVCVLWTTTSSTSQIGQTVTNLTTKDSLDAYATIQNFTFSVSGLVRIRNGKKYSWIAVFMPE